MKIIKIFLLSICTIIISSSNSSAQDNHAGIKNALYYAASTQNTTKIEQYINLGYSIDEIDENGFTALCTAIAANDKVAYNILIEYGANEDAQCITDADDDVTDENVTYFRTFINWLAGLAVVGGLVAFVL